MLKKFTNLLSLLRSDGGLRLLTKKPRSLASFRLVNYFPEKGLSFHTVIDSVANAGQFTRAASWAFPTARIHSFEPLPDIAGRFRENLADIAARHLVYQTARDHFLHVSVSLRFGISRFWLTQIIWKASVKSS